MTSKSICNSTYFTAAEYILDCLLDNSWTFQRCFRICTFKIKLIIFPLKPAPYSEFSGSWNGFYIFSTNQSRKKTEEHPGFILLHQPLCLLSDWVLNFSYIYIYILFSFPLFWLRLQHLSSFSIASDLISLYPALSSVYPTYSHPLNISKMQIWSC